MNLDVTGDKEPTSLQGIHDTGGVISVGPSYIPIASLPYILKSYNEHEGGQKFIGLSDKISVYTSGAVVSKSDDSTCDLCGDKLDLEIDFDELGDSTEVGMNTATFIIITVTEDLDSDDIISHIKCYEKLIDKSSTLLEEKPELITALEL